MAWKAVGPVVKKVVDRIVDTGETGVAAPVVSRKNAEAEAPASVTGQRQGEEKPATASHERMNVALRLVSSRCKSAHDPRRAPPRRADFHLMLVVDNVGRSPAGSGNRAPAGRVSPRGQAREF
jgi:hypothetical protein